MKILPTLQEENSGTRFRTGQGKPGLNILLGGTLQDEDINSTFGGSGGIGATARLAGVYRDTRLRQVAGGQRTYSSTRFGDYAGPGGGALVGPGGTPIRRPTRPGL